jgi:uncharacterized protein (DUF433 family)
VKTPERLLLDTGILGRLCHPRIEQHRPFTEWLALGGTAVFRGTRVPVKNLVDCLAAGDTLDQFLDDFPSVSREQAVAALELARDLLIAGARPPR